VKVKLASGRARMERTNSNFVIGIVSCWL
jgi:hypothetical protein